jgi:hypothetical protein
VIELKYRYYGKKYRVVPIVDPMVHRATVSEIENDPGQFVYAEYVFTGDELLMETDISKLHHQNDKFIHNGVICTVERVIANFDAVEFYTNYTAKIEPYTDDEYKAVLDRINKIKNNKLWYYNVIDLCVKRNLVGH